jgi:hypothetical protein
MKIVMFQYNRESSAILSENTRGRTHSTRKLVENTILANGYTDRLLWEEAASLRPRPKNEYIIPGHWQ